MQLNVIYSTQVMNMKKQIENKQSIEEMRHLIVLLARQFGLLQKESSQCCGVTMIQSHILYEINHTHQLSLNELAERLGLDNSTTSRHIHGLVEKGYVERKPHPTDRRYVTLGLSEKGIALEESISTMMNDYVLDLFNHLPEGKIHSMTSELKLLTEAMCKSDYCCKPPLS